MEPGAKRLESRGALKTVTPTRAERRCPQQTQQAGEWSEEHKAANTALEGASAALTASGSKEQVPVSVVEPLDEPATIGQSNLDVGQRLGGVEGHRGAGFSLVCGLVLRGGSCR